MASKPGKNKDQHCCSPTAKPAASWKVESLISVDERGQMVLPKDIREKARIRAGDKLAVISWKKEGEICCISLIKADELADMIKGLLGPMIKEIVGE